MSNPEYLNLIDPDLLRQERETRLGSNGAKPHEWRQPQPLPGGLPDVPSFSAELLPVAFRPWVMDVAERMQCPPDYPAVGVMVAAGSLIGRQLTIRPKQRDDWTVVPNLWGMIVGRPSLLKSPALHEAMRPLLAMEAEAAERYRQALADWEAGQVVAKEAEKVNAGEIRKLLKSGQHAAALALARQDLEGDAEPVRRRFIINDSTVEKLGVILGQNSTGVLIFRDELVGFLRAMERAGHEQDRAFYLEAWSGLGRFTFDRIGRGTLDIEACCVSILGGIQPRPLSDYLAAAVRLGAADDGLIQRFQLAVWPNSPTSWRDVDRWPHKDAKRTAADALRQLERIDHEAVGAEHDDDGLPFLRFDPDAQGAFREWRAELEKRLRSGQEHPALEAHLAKYRSLVPSLALIGHLADGGVGPVPEEEVIRAAAWAEYLEGHARRIYRSVTHEQVEAAHRLASKLMTGELASPFVLKDVYRCHWSGPPDRRAAQGAVEVLIDHGWLADEVQPTAGRSKTVYHFNPRAIEAGNAMD
jgi:putative DNA primase/helicase